MLLTHFPKLNKPAQARMTIYSRISGTGSFLPPRRLTNQDLVDQLAAKGIESSDEWIVERTGISARHFAEPNVNSSDLAFEACVRALKAAGRSASDVDLIIVATSTPDMVFPSTATILQHKLTKAALADGCEKGAAGCPAFDVQAVCSGFIYALSVADAMVRARSATCALVVGAEVFSRILDFNDRTTCVLFGDGAGAVVLEATEHDGQSSAILATDIHADGKHRDILCTPGTVSGGQILGDPTLKMDGPAVFKLAVGLLDGAARAALDKAGMDLDELDWLVPHQANIRIMQSTAKKLKLPAERVVVTVHEHGNTSAASIPLALDHGVRNGQVQTGQTVLLEGVGGGFTWGAVLLRM